METANPGIVSKAMTRRTALKAMAAATAGAALTTPGSALAAPWVKTSKTIKIFADSQPQFLNSNRYWAQQAQRRLGLTVEIESEPYGTQFSKATAAWIANRADFDLIVVANQWIGTWAGAGFLENLDPYVSADHTLNKADFIPRSWDLMGRWTGPDRRQHQYLIPFNSEGRIRFYRTDIFAKAKLAVPTNFTDYLRLLKFFHNNRDYPGLYGSVEMFGVEQAPAISHELYHSMFPWHQVPTANGWWDNHFQVIMKKNLVARAISMIHSILPYQPGGVASFNLPEAIAFFESGKAAMTEVWPSAYGPTLLSGTKLKGRVGASPVLAAAPGLPAKPFLGGWGMGINARSPADRKNAAWQFIVLSTSRAAEHHDWVSYGRGPNRQSVYNDPGLQQKYFWLKEMGTAAAIGVNAGRIKGMSDFYSGDFWITDNQGELGTLSPTQAARRMRSALIDVLNKNGYKQTSA